MRITTILIAFLGYLLSFQSAFSQRFPININVQAVNPSPIYFSEYANQNALTSPLRLQILLSDLTITNRQIKIKASFRGNGIRFESVEAPIGVPSLFIDGGVPLSLTNVELAPLFEFQNIIGITPEVYGNSIPEGSYQVCFQVYDVATNRQLSAESCTTIVIFQNDPPLLVLPFKDRVINAITTQNIIFQWTPRHINVSNVEYELNMVEVWDRTVGPQTAFFSSPPVFTTTINSTSFRYGPEQPQLLPNKRYAWQVQAKARRGAEEIGLFKNNGFSQIYWFDYTVPCSTPQNISHEVKGKYKTNLYWDANIDVLSYTLRYREANNPNAEWFQSKTREDWLTLWDLKEETEYEYQLQSVCELGESDFSESNYFTTNGEEDEDSYYNCGIPSDITLENKEPLEEIFVDEIFMAGDFPIRVKSISNSGGRFTGTGLVAIPYLKNAGISVKFTNILINTDKQLAEGVVVTTYDPELKGIIDVDEAIKDIKEFVNDVADAVDDVGDVLKGADKKEVVVDFEIADDGVKIDKEKGKIIITGTNGETKEIDYDEDDDYQIAGSGGKVYRINNEIGGGKPEVAGEVAEGGAPNPQNTGGITEGSLKGSNKSNGTRSAVAQIASDKVEIAFNIRENTTYGYDVADSDYEKQSEAYPTTKDANNNEIYLFHKAVAEGETDTFYAKVTIKDTSISMDDFVIKTVTTGRKIEHSVNGNTLEISVKGFNGYSVEEAIITYKTPEGNQQVATSFFIHHLRKQNNVKLRLVPFGRVTNVASYEEKIKSIYEKAGISFDLQTLPTFNPDSSTWDVETENGQLDYDGSGSFSNIPKEFRAVAKAYSKTSGFDKQAYYVFVTDINTTNPLGGFMPKGSQFGFVFDQNNIDIAKRDIAETIAHEVGHGLYGLEHPFKGIADKNSGTNWLMDYNGGTEFPIAHWKALGSEAIRLDAINFFQDDEDNQSATFKFRPSEDLTVNINGNNFFQFLSPAGQIVNIAFDEFVSGTFYFGIQGDNFEHLLPSSLIDFSIYRDKKVVKYTLDFNSTTSSGYFADSGKPFVPLTKELKEKKVLIGYASDKNDFAIAKHKYENAVEYSQNTETLLFVDFVNFYPNIENRKAIQRFDDRKLVGTNQNQITPAYRATLKNHYKSKEFLIILKIAEWRVRYPEFFKKFTSTFDNWNEQNQRLEVAETAGYTINGSKQEGTKYKYYGVWNEQMKLNSELYKLYKGNAENRVQFYRQFLTSFRNFIEQPSTDTRDCLESIESNYDSITFERLLECITNASQDELRLKLAQENRQLAIKKILSKSWVSGDYEKAIVKLFTYTPKNFEENLFFNFFESNCNITVVGNRNGAKGTSFKTCLWSILFDKVDDGAFLIANDTNRKDLMVAILNNFYKSKRYRDKAALIKNSTDEEKERIIKENTFYFNYKNFVVRFFSSEYEDLTTSVSSNSKVYIKQTGSSNDRKTYIDPFDLTYLINKSYLKNGSVFKKRDKKGLPDAMPVPAIILHYLSKDAEIKTTTDAIVTSLDVASLLATGTPTSQLAKLLFYADRISSVASIATTAIDNDDSELSKVLNGLSTVLGVADLTNLGREGLQKLIKKNSYVNLTRSEAIEQVNSLSKEINKLNTPEGKVLLKKLYVSETDDGLLALEQTLERNIKTLDITDTAKRIEIEEAIQTIKKTKKTVSIKGVAKSIDENLKFLKDARGFKKDFIDNTFFKLFDESPILSKIEDVTLRKATKEKLQNEALNYFKENTDEGYQKLYDLFLKNEINIDRVTGKPWPPFDGFIAIEEKVGNEITKVLDRFQTPYDKKSVEVLRGGFASPVFVSKYQNTDIPLPFTYESRALLTNVEENLVYINFKFNPSSDMKVQMGQSIPWGKTKGRAIQYKMSENFAKLKEGADYIILEKLIYKKGKWRKIPDGFKDYGKKFDNILEKIKCP